MSENRLYPDFAEIQKMTPDYIDEDFSLVKFLDKALPTQWELFFEPFYNGGCPDLVIMNPSVGLMVFIIKKWVPGEVCLETEKRFDPKTKKVSTVRNYFRTTNRKPIKIPDRSEEHTSELQSP